MNDDKRFYQRNIQIALIGALLCLILLFYSFPRANRIPSKLPDLPAPELNIIEIPRTKQTTSKKRPPPLLPSIPVESEEPDIADDVIIRMSERSDTGQFPILTSAEISELSLIPRQILEVIPEQSSENIKGIIILSLKIGTDGMVKEYQVVENTTRSQKTLTQVIEAAQNSKWQPIILDNIKYEYWIEKSYIFK